MLRQLMVITHVVTFGAGFVVGIYLLPILTAPSAPDPAAFAAAAVEPFYTARFERTLKGSDFVHWGEGEVRVSRSQIAHVGRLAPGPDYKLYLAPRFVDTKAAFVAIKDQSLRVGEVKTFDGFIVNLPPGVDVRDYSAVVVWCETFNQFISAAAYQPSRQARK